MGAGELKLFLNKNLKKYANNKSLYVIIIIGIAFMLFSGSPKKDEDNIMQNHDAYSDEVRLQQILSEIDGVGKVYVMVTYYGTTTKDIAFENNKSVSCSADERVESEENSVITSGNEPMVKGMVYPVAKGVVIIAEGAGDIRVKKNITDATTAVLDIPTHKICVLEAR